MTPEEIEISIVEADRCARLGMWWEAWDIIESLPPADRALPAVLAVRLLVCAGLRRWAMGTEIVRLFSPGLPLSLRESAGRYHLAHAETLCAAGLITAAKDAVRELALVWPEGSEAALKSPALAAVW